MSQLLHQLISQQSKLTPSNYALGCQEEWLTYQQLEQQVTKVSRALLRVELGAQERVAIYLPKCIENVITMFAASQVRGVFVPINPVLKEEQANHILKDCEAKILVTNFNRWQRIESCLPKSVTKVVITDLPEQDIKDARIVSWSEFTSNIDLIDFPRGLETDVAAIFYTSGSTGRAKGVVLSQRNMVIGAYSVAEYLDSQSDDRLLAAQPLSFDYGFSQLSIAFATGAGCYLVEFLFPQDVIKAVQKQQITCLAFVPPLWLKLAELVWPDAVRNNIRYFTNTGGAMPQATLNKLMRLFPNARPYLMYGLTEAFRSCYLPPKDVGNKPGSFGKAIPNAEIHVINQQGQLCKPGEQGELVHSGPLVSLGYWNDREKTKSRFKPLPWHLKTLANPPVAVWSGDLVTQDADGFLYFVSRNDDMIKTSGYRVSPQEIEEVIHDSGLVSEVVALGVPHRELGQAILLFVVANKGNEIDLTSLIKACRQHFPLYMQPREIIVEASLGRNANGKIDRTRLSQQYKHHFIGK